MKNEAEALLTRKRELLDRLAAIRADISSGLDTDSEEQAIQLENFEVLQEIQRLAEEELKTIELKLAKL